MVQRLKVSFINRALGVRAADTHKGDFGHVLVVAGSRELSGAAVLSALGALRAGAGLVTVSSDDEAQAVVRRLLPEAMTIGRGNLEAFISKRKITTLAIGPGLGLGAAQKMLIRRLLNLQMPTVLDADGLNNVSLEQLPIHAANLVITPHEGELAHLRGIRRETVHQKRRQMAHDTAKHFGGTCVLKGHRTLICSGDRAAENHTGNSAMATGGMGDVLTGVIAGLLAQKLTPWAAACAGVYLHGLAGDLAAVTDRGLLARDVANAIPQALAKVRKRAA